LELARSPACAHLNLVRIRKVRAEIITRLDVEFELFASRGSKFDLRNFINDDFPRHERKLPKLLRDPQDQLRRLNRYEQRSASERGKALRAI
jgi:hypothetical protein